MSRRIIAVLIAFTLAAAALASTAALGSGESQQAPQAQKKTYTFYLVAGIASDAFYLTMKKGAQAAAKKLGNVKVVFTGSPAASDASSSDSGRTRAGTPAERRP